MGKADSKKKIIVLSVILGLSLSAMIALITVYVIINNNSRQGTAFYASLSVDLTARIPQPAAAPDDALSAGAGRQQTVPAGHIAPETAEPAPFVPAMDFGELRELMPDAVGWIYSPGTLINYPIVRAENNVFYLDHLPDRTRNSMGSIFLDYRNSADLSDGNIFIYGHNMRSRELFGSLGDYADQAFFDAHSSMYIFTPHADYELQLFAGYLLDSAYEHPPMQFESEDDFQAYMAELESRSFFTGEVDVSYGDTLVFLCTCTDGRLGDASRSMRRILVGRLADVN